MVDGLSIYSAPFDHALARLALTSKKAAVDVLRQQAKMVVTNVAKWTPPAGEATGKAAEKYGKAAVAGDIRSLYGQPDDAYAEIAKESPAQASAFWFLHQSGEDRAASDVLRAATGNILAPFDGGKFHRSMKRSVIRRRGRGKGNFTFYVSDPKELDAYIQEQQKHIWWLASGWADALTALGGKLPYGVGKHNAPGLLKVEISDQRIIITFGNEVKFASQVKDIERRFRWSMNIQTEKLDRQWKHFIERAGKGAGFKVS